MQWWFVQITNTKVWINQLCNIILYCFDNTSVKRNLWPMTFVCDRSHFTTFSMWSMTYKCDNDHIWMCTSFWLWPHINVVIMTFICDQSHLFVIDHIFFFIDQNLTSSIKFIFGHHHTEMCLMTKICAKSLTKCD